MIPDAYREPVAYTLLAAFILSAAIVGLRYMSARRRRLLRMRGIKTYDR